MLYSEAQHVMPSVPSLILLGAHYLTHTAPQPPATLPLRVRALSHVPLRCMAAQANEYHRWAEDPQQTQKEGPLACLRHVMGRRGRCVRLWSVPVCEARKVTPAACSEALCERDGERSGASSVGG